MLDPIEVIYPKDSQIVNSIDSTFILGNIDVSLTKDYGFIHTLYINNTKITIHKDGGFLAFLPVNPGMFTFYLLHIVEQEKDKKKIFVDSVALERVVQIPEPLQPIPFDSLIIVKEINPPAGDMNLKTGDRLQVTIQGTPGCEAYFQIPNVADSIPMAETTPRTQPYWGESVFGVGAVPDSLLLRGIYTGFYDIPPEMRADSIHLLYILKYPKKDKILKQLSDTILDKSSALQIHKLDSLKDDCHILSSSYSLSINNPDFPFTVRFTDSVQIIRHGPRKGYFSIFQPKGVEAEIVSSEGDWYIAELSKTQKAYINKHSVEKLPKGILPPHSYLSVVRFKSSEDNLKVEFPLSGKHPFRIIEEDKRTIRIQLFGVTTDTDWIRYDFSDPLVEIATWSQPEEKMYELKLSLSKNIWGYDTYYRGNTFYFKLNKAPKNVKKLKGKTIVIDPGHSSDKGAVGPTGLTEADANLAISLKLRDILESKGAKVIMTRDDKSHVALYDRPAIAKKADADIFVSIHNNALPDGVNPFENNGSSTYYYHPHSIVLAKYIQKELVQAVKLGDYGLYHGNLAVNRPTQYPAVLVENAFMIIPEQEALLKSDKFRKKIAKAITKGIEQFLKQYHNENK